MPTVFSVLARYLDSLKSAQSNGLLLENSDPEFTAYLRNAFDEKPIKQDTSYDYLPNPIFNRRDSPVQSSPNATQRASIATSPLARVNGPPIVQPTVDTSAPAPLKKNNPNRMWENEDAISAAKNVDTLRLRIIGCRRCGLSEGRQHIVFGSGDIHADTMFIGEGPGREEDVQGLPFVGKSGQLLTQMIHAIGLNRNGVYITNVVKCRPPNNRTPHTDEIKQCLPILKKQLELMKPRLIVVLGGTALKSLFGDTVPGITKARGRMMSFANIPVIPTFHPSYLLRSPKALYDAWEDFRQIRKFLFAHQRKTDA